jgi:hypothetical protein
MFPPRGRELSKLYAMRHGGRPQTKTSFFPRFALTQQHYSVLPVNSVVTTTTPKARFFDASFVLEPLIIEVRA